MDVYEEQDFDVCVDLQKVELVLPGCSSQDTDSAANEKLDYSLFMLGLLPWLFFLSLLGSASASVTGRVKVRYLSCQKSRVESRAPHDVFFVSSHMIRLLESSYHFHSGAYSTLQQH